MPSLSTSLCNVIGAWGFTSFKKLNYPNESIRVNISHKVVIIIHVRSVIIGVFRRIKIFIVILYKLVDLIEVVCIKVVTLSTLSAKSCALSFRIESQSRIIRLAVWFKKVFDFTPRLSMISF